MDGRQLRHLILEHVAEHGVVTRADAYRIEGRDDRVGHSVAMRAVRDLARDGWLTHEGGDTWTAGERAGETWEPAATGTTWSVGASDAAEVLSDTKADDPLQRAGGRRADPNERVAALVAEAERLEAAGVLDDETRELLRQARAAHADHWQLLVPGLFPQMAGRPFAPHHGDLWDWVWSIEAEGPPPRPFAALWSRGSAKSSTAEMAAVMLGHRRRRRYVLYVSGRQSKADDHVESIAEMLESAELAQVDAELTERRLGKYGASRGWRHNRLTTRAGFTVDAVGLDVDIRGARLGDTRPDLIIFDDVDAVTDSPAVIERKLLRVTRDIIPAGDPDRCAFLFVQNVIHPLSIAARLGGVGDAPDPGFFATRIVSGPIPAVEGLEVAERYDDELGRNRSFIVAGTPTWEGFGLAACQRLMDDEGVVAFLAECQHEQGTLKGGMFDHVDFAVRRGSVAELPALSPVEASDGGDDHPLWRGPCAVWCDPAVTSTDRSDSCAVTVGGLAPDGKKWCLYAWEHVASPEEAMRVALEAGMRWGAQVCGFETDQGGDTWEVVYRKVVADLLADSESYVARRAAAGVPVPRYDWAKAGGTEGNLSKRGRINQLVARYDVDEFRHLDGGASVLEAGVWRVPKFKPFAVVGSGLHCLRGLAQRSRADGGGGYRARSPSRRAAPIPEVRP